jgi:hypothetical protein
VRRVVEWNGRDLPAGLRELPPGRYVVETELDPEERERDSEELRSLAARESGFDLDETPGG